MRAVRFELTTPCAQGRCATRLRYARTLRGLERMKGFTLVSGGLEAHHSTIELHPLKRGLVPLVGLEPTRPCGHRILNPACLPVPTQWHKLSWCRGAGLGHNSARLPPCRSRPRLAISLANCLRNIAPAFSSSPTQAVELVAGAGLEPAWPCGQGILSPQRLPIPPPRHISFKKSDCEQEE